MSIEKVKNDPAKVYQYIGWIICLGVFVYVCFRAALISISHDEATTYLIHVRRSFTDILFMPYGLLSNNHLLNTLLIKAFTNWFGPSEFVIRMPALIGCLLYIIAGYKLLRLFVKDLRLVVGIILLITNPFIIDFFSCARGYSLGLGFLMCSLYCCFKRISPSANTYFYNSLAIAAVFLSVLSQLTFINAYLVIAALLFLLEIGDFFRGDNRSLVLMLKNFALRVFLPVSLSSLYLCLIYNPYIIQSMKRSYEFGGRIGFWQDTVRTLVQCTLRDNPYAGPVVINVVMASIALCILLAFAIAGYSLFIQKHNTDIRYLFLMCLIVLLFIVIINIETVFCHVLYPYDRSGIYFIPLFFLFFISLWNSLGLLAPMANKAISMILYGVALMVIVHNLYCVNLSNFYLWQYDASTKQAMDIIDSRTKAAKEFPGLKYNIGINWMFEPSVNYYILTRKMTQLNLGNRLGPDNFYDFYYFLPEDKQIMDKYHLKAIKTFEPFPGILAKS